MQQERESQQLCPHGAHVTSCCVCHYEDGLKAGGKQMTHDEQFKEMVLGWIKEELDKTAIVQTAQDPFGLDCQPVKPKPRPKYSNDIVPNYESYKGIAIFHCKKCNFTHIFKKDSKHTTSHFVCPKCDITLFDISL